MKYISLRTRGFNIQIDAETYLVFPQGKPVDVPEKLIPKVESYCPQYLEKYEGPAPAPPKKEARVVKSQPPLYPKREEEESLPDNSLQAANIPQVAISALVAIGILNIGDLTDYIDDGKSLSAVKGIGEKLETEIIGCLVDK